MKARTAFICVNKKLLTTAEQLSAELERYKRFEECMLVEARMLHPGMDFELAIHYVWSEDQTTVVEEPLRVSLICANTLEFRFRNEMTDQFIAEREQVSWGYTEISLLRAETDSLILDRHAKAHDFRPLMVEALWEGDGHSIQVVCRGVEIRELEREPYRH
ncbi:MAG: hypothetical protein ACRDKI_00270 [Solirubrobacterales bacterium]